MRDRRREYVRIATRIIPNLFLLLSISMKPVRIIGMCVNELYKEVQVGTYFSNTLPINKCLNK
jgi:hypothetical protein